MTNTGLTKHLLLPACIGAAITYGVLIFSHDDSPHREQIQSLESRILDLELSLAQKEEELADARFFPVGAFNPTDTAAQTSEKTANVATATDIINVLATEESPGTSLPPDSQLILRDLGTRSDRDPRSFSEKANDLLTGNPNKESIALVSKSVFDMAENHELLPDYELESLYQNQSNPDLKRVIAQVMSTRGDNSLLEKQIAKTQASLRSESPADRQRALVELGKTRHASAANVILPMLQDSDTGVKLDALLALRTTGNQSHVRQVEILLNHPDPAVSWLAKDVVNNLRNLSENARTQLGSEDIVAELPVVNAP